MELGTYRCFVRLERGQEAGEKRRNEELGKHDLSPDVMSTLKSRTFRWAGHVAHMM